MDCLGQILLDMNDKLNKLTDKEKEQIPEAIKIIEREKQKFIKKFPDESCLAFDLALCMLKTK